MDLKLPLLAMVFAKGSAATAKQEMEKCGNTIGGFLACSRVTFEVGMRTSQSDQLKGLPYIPRRMHAKLPHISRSDRSGSHGDNDASQPFELSPVYQFAKKKIASVRVQAHLRARAPVLRSSKS